MRKTRKSERDAFNLILIFAVVILMIGSAQAAVESIKDKYYITEPVSVRSTSTPLCNNVQKTENVTLYIVENKDVWNNGDSLTDVRAQAQQITNSQFQSIIVWNSPKAGFYDIIIDCDKDEKYYNEPIDSFDKIGFEVIAVAGTGKAKIGEKDIGSHSWMYDSEEPDLATEMLQISLTAEGESIKLSNITIRAAGTGKDAELDKIEVYADENNNGRIDANEPVIGDSQPAYSEDNGLTTINLDYVSSKDASKNILIAYQMKQTTSQGDYSLSVISISGAGEESGSSISFAGFPINSGTNKVLPPKTCLGTLALKLEPNPAIEENSVNAKISGLNGCQNRTVVLRINPCGSSIPDKIGSCVLGAEGCTISFTALASKTYHACINKNEDGDMVDIGEYAFVDLVVNPKPKPASKTNATNATKSESTGAVEEVKEVEETTEKETTPAAGITGGVIGGLTEKLSGTGTVLITLEMTLLLIFIVLVVIAFRLKSAKKSE